MKYVDTIDIDRDTMTLAALDEILEELRGPGEVEVIEESPGRITGIRFTVEAADLWELHEVAEEVETIIESNFGSYVIDRAHVLEDEEGDPRD